MSNFIDTFLDDITAARSLYNSRQTESPLIAWVSSKEWAPKLKKDSASGRWKLPQMFRGCPGTNGSVWRSNGETQYTRGFSVVTGEIPWRVLKEN